MQTNTIMKTNIGKMLINLLLIIAIQYSCKKDENESFVDDYNPELTENQNCSRRRLFPMIQDMIGIGWTSHFQGTYEANR